jgi:hypothetical protein
MAKSTVITQKKKRGPPATGKGTLIGVRLHSPALDALDALIDDRPAPKPSRPEAIREILDAKFNLSGDGDKRIRQAHSK